MTCAGYREVWKFPTSDRIVGPKTFPRFEVNLVAVWGQTATGDGSCKMNDHTLKKLNAQTTAVKNIRSALEIWCRTIPVTKVKTN